MVVRSLTGTKSLHKLWQKE